VVVDLLTTASAERARELARFLEDQNQQRQSLERKILAEAREQIAGDERHRGAALVLADPQWHPGVIGIVAGRLTDLYGRPVLVIAQSGAVAVGSGRSIHGFALHEALAACSDLLIGHGGHAAAAGFRIAVDRIDAFRDRFVAYTASRFPEGPPPPRLTLDAELPLSALTPGLLAQINRLEPYGAQNARPKFLATDLQLAGDPRKVGGGERHLSFRVRQGSTNMRAIAFGIADRAEELVADEGRCCIAFTPRLNEWNGMRSVEMEVIDFRAGSTVQLQ
jgi:single-stranded-DNA-specific exonuclease